MKRKLTLIFEDNQLAQITLAERGKRSKFLPINTSHEATCEVQKLLTTATTAITPITPVLQPATTLVTIESPEPIEVTEKVVDVLEERPHAVCARAKPAEVVKEADD